MGVSDKIMATGEDILAYIPQRPPMVMIDTLVDTDGKISESRLTIKKNNLFCQDGYFKEPGLVENIAQTIAVGVGYQTTLNKKETPLGFIAAVQNLKIFELPQVNSEIHTRVIVNHKVLNFTVVTGRILCKNRLITECDMKLYIQQ